ncbi:MAG TPA: NAD-dependent epimerase/dehydratase family protein [Solirubrobacterales bacterium]|nr:NAD-dependent epimerase/dehydratase family protein [Solirubrobacterales bacterium]
MPSRVFITGASGFIGRALAARLRGRGDEVRGVDLVADEAAGVLAGDIRVPGEWQEAMAGCDVVVHTAALVSNAFGLEASWRLNVLGTRLALEGAARAEAGRFVHFSSVRAFSDVDFPDGVGEEHPVRTNGNPYVDTKVASEQVALQAHAAGEVPVTVIRPGDVYGPGSRPWTVLPLAEIRANRFALPAMGRSVFSPVFVENLVDGVVLAIDQPQAAGQVYVLSDGVGVTTKEFFGHYFRMLGRRGPICLPTPVALALAKANELTYRFRSETTEVNPATIHYLTRRGTYSIEKARRELGFEPRIGLAGGMALTEKWLREEGLI